MNRWYIFILLMSLLLMSFDRVFPLDKVHAVSQLFLSPLSYGLYQGAVTLNDGVRFVKGLPALMAGIGYMLDVIHRDAAQAFIIPDKTAWFDDIQRHAKAGPKAQHRPRIGWHVGLVQGKAQGMFHNKACIKQKANAPQGFFASHALFGITQLQ